MVKFFEYIDKIIYINLDYRIDRKEEIENEFKRLQIPSDKIIRFSAIRTSDGAIGCSLSHIEVLKMAIENKWKNYLVLEDDCNFIDDTEFIDKVIEHFFNNVTKWDVLNFGRGMYQQFSDTNVKYIQKVHDVSTTTAYIVNQDFYEKLLQNFVEGCENFKRQHNRAMYCIDRYWKSLQQDSNWYITNPSISYQRTGFSTIENMDVNYIQYDNTLVFGKIDFKL